MAVGKIQKSKVKSQKTTSAIVRKTKAITKKVVSDSQVSEKRVNSENKLKKLFTPVTKYKKQIVLFFIVLCISGLLYIFSKWFIIAWVDKVPVTRLQYYLELEKRNGTQIKEQLITQQLVINEAKNKGINISQDEINVEYKKVQDQVGAEMLGNLLKQQNISDKDFRSQLKLQLLVRKMFGQGINVNDEEINNLLKQSSQATDSSQPADQKQKDQAKEQLINQKVSQAFQAWLKEAQSGTRVNRF